MTLLSLWYVGCFKSMLWIVKSIITSSCCSWCLCGAGDRAVMHLFWRHGFDSCLGWFCGKWQCYVMFFFMTADKDRRCCPTRCACTASPSSPHAGGGWGGCAGTSRWSPQCHIQTLVKGRPKLGSNLSSMHCVLEDLMVQLTAKIMGVPGWSPIRVKIFL